MGTTCQRPKKTPKITKALVGRRITLATGATTRFSSSDRHSHAGTPTSMSRATTYDSSRCCSMWAESR
jgi:hypothetical protein